MKLLKFVLFIAVGAYGGYLWLRFGLILRETFQPRKPDPPISIFNGKYSK